MLSLKKKYAVGIFLIILLVIFIGFQFLFLKNIFGIDPFARDILPKGFCKDCNVILISLDALRAKSLPCYGNDKNTSPNLCNFANKSFLFKNTYSQSAFTLDSHFSIFTSLYPISHKMTETFVSNLSEQIVTFPQKLKEYNYMNLYGGVLAALHLSLDKGLGRGFDSLLYAQDPEQWIKSLDKFLISNNKKFFAFLHTYEVHDPYIPEKINVPLFYSGPNKEFISTKELCEKRYAQLSQLYRERINDIDSDSRNKNISVCDKLGQYESKYANISQQSHDQYSIIKKNAYWDIFDKLEISERKQYLEALYETKVYELDRKLQSFFDYLENKDLLNNTIVIITADHGESFYEHKTWTHGYNLYNEVIHVPLIIYVPNAKPQVLDKLSESTDIAPSILYLLGIEPPKQYIGMNIFSYQEKKAVISEHFSDRKYSILTRDWKLIINNDNKDGIVTKELYNLDKDYGETTNILDQHPETASSLEKSLNSILSVQPVYEQKNNQPFPTWVNEEQRKKLIETGYF